MFFVDAGYEVMYVLYVAIGHREMCYLQHLYSWQCPITGRLVVKLC